MFSEKTLPPNWGVNQPEFGLLLTFIGKVITFLLYFLKYNLTKHISGISKEKVSHEWILLNHKILWKKLKKAWKKHPGKKLNAIYLAFVLSGGQLFSFIYIGKSCAVSLV